VKVALLDKRLNIINKKSYRSFHSLIPVFPSNVCPYYRPFLLFAVCPILITTMGFQVAELRELAEVTLGGGWSETEMSDYGFCGDFVLIGHKIQNIDQFLGQCGLY
jgi:hypothetical protein